jgi:centractin
MFVQTRQWTPFDAKLTVTKGSGVIKAGFGGDDTPKTFFPSWYACLPIRLTDVKNSVGRPKHTRVMAGAVEGEKFIGKRAQELRGLLKINYPMRHGIVQDWVDMERIWHHVYSEELKTSSEEHPLLITEAPLNPKRHRSKAAEILFETFNVPALFVSIQAVLSLYASGRTTGLVLDSGDGVTHAVPVYEGFSAQNAVLRSDVAGRDVTEYLQLLLRKGGYHFQTSSELEIVRAIKERLCFLNTPHTRADKENADQEEFLLPDGNVLRMSLERNRAPEVLFSPELIGSEERGCHQLVADSIQKVDMDLRRTLWGNIVLSGGTTLTKNYGDRLLSETKKIAPTDVKIKINAPPERKYSTWIGGSILASLSTFKRMWVTAEEYEEDPEIIHRKTW